MEVDTNGTARWVSHGGVAAHRVVDVKAQKSNLWHVYVYHGEVWHPPYLNAVFIRPNPSLRWQRVRPDDGTPLAVLSITERPNQAECRPR